MYLIDLINDNLETNFDYMGFVTVYPTRLVTVYEVEPSLNGTYVAYEPKTGRHFVLNEKGSIAQLKKSNWFSRLTDWF